MTVALIVSQGDSNLAPGTERSIVNSMSIFADGLLVLEDRLRDRILITLAAFPGPVRLLEFGPGSPAEGCQLLIRWLECRGYSDDLSINIPTDWDKVDPPLSERGFGT